MILTINAAVASSFVTPAAAYASGITMSPMHGPAGTQSAPPSIAAMHQGHLMQMPEMPPLVRVAVSLNRGLAQVHIAILSIALMLYGFSLWRRSRVLAAAGLCVGAFPLLWQLSGRFSPETHTMPAIVFAQSAWIIAIAVRMLSTTNDATLLEQPAQATSISI